VTPVEEPRLAGGHAEEIFPGLAQHGEDALVALVGHEPDLSHLLARLVGGVAERLAFKKGGAALVEIDAAAPSSGRLIWFLPPRLLRRLGGD
jgi:phosphohistidine phosphatase